MLENREKTVTIKNTEQIGEIHQITMRETTTRPRGYIMTEARVSTRTGSTLDHISTNLSLDRIIPYAKLATTLLISAGAVLQGVESTGILTLPPDVASLAKTFVATGAAIGIAYLGFSSIAELNRIDAAQNALQEFRRRFISRNSQVK